METPEKNKPSGSSFVREFMTPEQFKNILALGLTVTYCVLSLKGITNEQFSLLYGVVLGFYFKKD